MFIILKTKATNTPVVTSKLRAWLKTDDDDDENKLIRSLALDAANRFEKYTAGRSILSHTFELWLDIADFRFIQSGIRGDVLKLQHKPISSITKINYYDDLNAEFTMVADTDYTFLQGDHTVEFARDFPTQSFREHNAMKITYVTGYELGQTPDDIIKSLEMYAAFLYEHRGDDEFEEPAWLAERWDPYIIHRFGGAF